MIKKYEANISLYFNFNRKNFLFLTIKITNIDCMYRHDDEGKAMIESKRK